jgi:hypothetical protein
LPSEFTQKESSCGDSYEKGVKSSLVINKNSNSKNMKEKVYEK